MSRYLMHNGKAYKMGDVNEYPLPEWFQNVQLPPRWSEIDVTLWAGLAGRDYARGYRYRNHLVVLASVGVYHGAPWLHLSVSRADKALPTWGEMSLVKDVLIGPERQAIQVHPPRSKHVNIHPGTLHLWHCVIGDGLPDFTGGGETI